MTRDASTGSARRRWRVLRAATAAVAIAAGLGVVLVAMTLGRCDAFGGRCPGDRPPLLEDDVFGTAAFGAALLVAVPVFVARPSVRRLLVAAGVGVAAALLVGLVARFSAHG